MLDRREEKIHQLNPTASFIWELCDGAQSLDEIAEGMTEAFEVDRETAAQGVVETIQQFSDLGLLEGAAQGPFEVAGQGE